MNVLGAGSVRSGAGGMHLELNGPSRGSKAFFELSAELQHLFSFFPLSFKF